MFVKPSSAFVGWPSVVCELLGQREERAVGEVVAVDEEQLARRARGRRRAGAPRRSRSSGSPSSVTESVAGPPRGRTAGRGRRLRCVDARRAVSGPRPSHPRRGPPRRRCSSARRPPRGPSASCRARARPALRGRRTQPGPRSTRFSTRDGASRRRRPPRRRRRRLPGRRAARRDLGTEHVGRAGRPRGLDTELVRDLYAVAAERWVADGLGPRTTRWSRRPIPRWSTPGSASASATSTCMRSASRPTRTARRRTRRADRAGGRGATISTRSPALDVAAARAPGPLARLLAGCRCRPFEEARGRVDEDFDDPTFTTFVAERDGAGARLGDRLPDRGLLDTSRASRARAAPGSSASRRSSPRPRGRGAGRLLGEAVLAWAQDDGHPSVVTDWRMTNLLVVARLAAARLPADLLPPVPRDRVARRGDPASRRIAGVPRAAALRLAPSARHAAGRRGARWHRRLRSTRSPMSARRSPRRFATRSPASRSRARAARGPRDRRRPAARRCRCRRAADDPRRDALAAVLDELERGSGSARDRQTMLVAGGLGAPRRTARARDGSCGPIGARELPRTTSSSTTARPTTSSRSTLGRPAAARPSARSSRPTSSSRVGAGRDRPARRRRRARSTRAACGRCAPPRPTSLLEPSGAPGWELAAALEAALARRCRSSALSLVLDRPRPTGATAATRATRRSRRRSRARRSGGCLNASPAALRRCSPATTRELDTVAALAGPPSVAHAEALLRGIDAPRRSARPARSTRSSSPLPWHGRAPARASPSTRSPRQRSGSATRCGSGATGRRSPREARSSCSTRSPARSGTGRRRPIARCSRRSATARRPARSARRRRWRRATGGRRGLPRRHRARIPRLPVRRLGRRAQPRSTAPVA